MDFILLTTIGIRRQHREMVGCQNDLHNCECQEEQLRKEIRRLQEELARLQRHHEEEIKQIEDRRKQLEEEERRKQKQYIKYLRSGNSLIDKANSLANHRENCPKQLLPAANELYKLIAEYVVAIVGTTSSTVVGAVTTGVLAACAPVTFGITGIIAAGTGAATVAIAAGGGVGAEKVRERMKNATDDNFRAQKWIMKDRELCTAMLGGVIAFEKNRNEMKRMFNDETSMHAYLERQGLEQLSEVQKRFTQLSAKVVQKWRDQKYDPQNEPAMRGGKAQARSAVNLFIHDPNRQHDFSTITLFFDYTDITHMLWEYAKEKKKAPRVKQLIEQIVSDLKADAEHIQHFAELKSMHYSKP